MRPGEERVCVQATGRLLPLPIEGKCKVLLINITEGVCCGILH